MTSVIVSVGGGGGGGDALDSPSCTFRELLDTFKFTYNF